MAFRTKHDLKYVMGTWGGVTTIPAGTPVTFASNLSDGGWWASKWKGMSEEEESWQRNYGFLITGNDVIKEVVDEIPEPPKAPSPIFFESAVQTIMGDGTIRIFQKLKDIIEAKRKQQIKIVDSYAYWGWLPVLTPIVPNDIPSCVALVFVLRLIDIAQQMEDDIVKGCKPSPMPISLLIGELLRGCLNDFEGDIDEVNEDVAFEMLQLRYLKG